jgi:PAS domain S-box-containing protein
MKYDLEYVLDSASDGIFIITHDHRLVLFNRACEDLYDISQKDLVNKACWKLESLKKLANFKARLGKSHSYGELASTKERMTLTHKSGKEVWVETIYTPIFDQDNGEIAYVLAVIKDISEQKNLEDEKAVLIQQLDEMRTELGSKYDFSNIVGRSSGIIEALKLTGEVARQDTTVLLMGESGTGKELLARAIHFNSRRSLKPFIALNCSAFPDTLIESELFGHEKGAFTGAEKYKPGKVQLAEGGTLFLDEVTELTAPAQAKILRLIQERECEPLGSVKIMRADIRIIAATNKNPAKLVDEGKLRKDLYYRLCVFPITLPPLRERPEDIAVLLYSCLTKMNRTLGKSIEGITPRAMDILTAYAWPGNVRELQNLMERMMILCKNPKIDVGDLPGYLSESFRYFKSGWERLDSFPEGTSLENHVRQFEIRVLLNTLKKFGFNKTRAAKALGLKRSTFRYKLAQASKNLSALIPLIN